MLQTTFQQVGCSSAIGNDFGLTQQSVTYTNSKDCFAACASSPNAAFRRSATTALPDCTCLCGTVQGFSPGTTCPAGGTFLYYHTPDAQVSGLSRRRLRLTARSSSNDLSPAGLKACSIDGTEGYEVRLESTPTRTKSLTIKS